MKRTPIPPTILPLILALAACEGAPEYKGPQSDPPPEQDKEGETDGEAEENTDAPAGLAAFGKNPFALLAKLDEPGPYDPPKQSDNFDAEKPHLLVLDLTAPLTEVESFSWFGGGGGILARDLQKALAAAKADQQVRGLLVRVDTGMGMAAADRLRTELEAFKQADTSSKDAEPRTVTCHAESLYNGSYHALTACDRLVLAPIGMVSIPGPAASNVHLKRMMDKVGVEAQMLHIGAYKGAAEPLTRTEPSDEARETLQAILDQAYTTMITGLKDGRGLTEEQAKAAIDQALFVGEQAKEAKLVDAVATFEATRDEAVGERGWKKIDLGGDPMKDPTAIPRLLGMMPPEKPLGDHVALVYAVGNVVDGRGQGIIGATQQMASGTLVPALHALAEDDSVKAVVMRVDSPGGSALASELIWQATRGVADKKPFVVSMGNVAASGGYYVSAGAEKIYAEPNTLTGSIGVVGGKIVYGDALKKLGVDTYGMSKGERGLMWSSMDAWDDDDQALVQAYMQDTYDVFVGRVSEGRGMERDAVHEVAQGRVWTGVDAKARGLVDEVGGLDEALAYAHEKAGVDPSKGLEIYPPEPTLRDILGSLGSVQSPVGMGTLTAGQVAWSSPVPLPLRQLVSELALIDVDLADQAHDTLELVFALRNEQVWAVSFVPRVR